MTYYLNLLVNWIQANPEWAILLTFLIALSESIIIIGTLIPGSVTMTGIGILAGSGVMRIDLALGAAIAGAIVGDFGSYLIGYIFKNRIPSIWPFSKYPHWINYTKDYFNKHGGKSVFFGRFIGPIRAIIPVVAGMMHMNKLQFLVANIASAFGWAIIYIMPGYLIGAASIELADGSRKRLIIILLIFIISFLILIKLVTYLYRRSKSILYKVVKKSSKFARTNALARYYMKKLAPQYEKIHHRTTKLILSFIFFLFLAITIYWLMINNAEVLKFNYLIYLVGQSFHSNFLNNIFIILSFFINNISLFTILLTTCIYFIYLKDFKTLFFWLSIFLTCGFIFLVLGNSLPQLERVFHETSQSFNPALNISVITALMGFLFALTHKSKQHALVTTIRFILILLLALGALASIYLGEVSISNVIEAFVLGITVFIGYWIFYRRTLKFKEDKSSRRIIIYVLALLILSLLLSYKLHFEHIKKIYNMTLEKTITYNQWWHKIQDLPLFHTTNLIGNKQKLLNLQFSGSIEKLHNSLANYGWKEESGSLLFNLLLNASGQPKKENLSFATRFFQNKKPVLTMTYKKSNNILVLQFWSSNYIIKHKEALPEPLWLGTLYIIKENTNNEELFKVLQPAIKDFHTLHIIKQDKKILLIDD